MKLRSVIGIFFLLVSVFNSQAQDAFQRVYPATNNETHIVVDAVQLNKSLFASLQYVVDTTTPAQIVVNDLVYSTFRPKGDVDFALKINLDPKIYGGVDMNTKANIYIGTDGLPYITVNTLKGPNGKKQIIKINRDNYIITSSKNVQTGIDSVGRYNIIGGYADYLFNVVSTGDKTNSSVVLARTSIKENDLDADTTIILNTTKNNGQKATEVVSALAINAKMNRIAIVGTIDSSDMRPFLLVMDTTSNILFSRRYISLSDTIPDTINKYFITDLAITKDTGYLVSGYYHTKKSSLDQGVAGFILHLDKKGNVIWGRQLKKTSGIGNDYIQSMAFNADGQAVVGAVFQQSNTSVATHYAFEIDLNGGAGDKGAYLKQGASTNRFGNIFKTENGTAWFTNTASGKLSQLSIIKLDNDLKTTCQDPLTDQLLTNLKFKADTLVWTSAKGNTFRNKVTDTAEVTNYDVPVLKLTDTLYCPNTPINYLIRLENKLENVVSYKWNTGETTETLRVNDDAEHSLMVIINKDVCFMLCDTTKVKKSALPTANLDSSLGDFCTSGKLTLNANMNPGLITNTSYKWSTGSSGVGTSSSIMIDKAGLYSIVFTDGCLDNATASVTIDQYPANITKVTLTPSINIDCLNGTFRGTIKAEGNSTTTGQFGLGVEKYLWSDGTTNQTINIDQDFEGLVTVTVTDGCGKTSTASYELIFNGKTNFTISLVIDKSQICQTKQVRLNAFTNPSGNRLAYLWSAGETTPFIETNKVGTFTVTVTDICKNTSTATKTLSDYDISPEELKYAKVFFPDGVAVDDPNMPNDTLASKALYLNRTFGPFAAAISCPDQLENYKFYVFNRWGQQVFEADDITEEWDGTDGSGTRHPSDTYLWVAQYTVIGQKKVQKGDVTMIR
jgi:hypothetical protein